MNLRILTLTVLALASTLTLTSCGQMFGTGSGGQNAAESAAGSEEIEQAREELEAVEEEIAQEESRLEALRRQIGQLAEQTKDWTVETTEGVRPTVDDWTNRTAEEWAELNQWEYKTEIASATATPLEDLLNQSGAEGWELVSIAEVEGETVIVYRRRPESFFRNIPARDILRMLLMFGGAGGA